MLDLTIALSVAVGYGAYHLLFTVVATAISVYQAKKTAKAIHAYVRDLEMEFGSFERADENNSTVKKTH